MTLDRREFLLAAGAAGTAGLLAACSGSKPTPPPEQPVVTQADHLEGDLSVAALLASLENLLVALYRESLDRKERLGPYPPAVQAMFETAQRQHKEHANAWNGILTGAGKRGVTGVNLTVKASATEVPLQRARDANALLVVCQEVENITAVTYLAAMGAFQNNAALKVAASIHPVENEHIAVVNFLLGRTPAADSFVRTDGARPTSDSIG